MAADEKRTVPPSHTRCSDLCAWRLSAGGTRHEGADHVMVAEFLSVPRLEALEAPNGFLVNSHSICRLRAEAHEKENLQNDC